MINILISGTEGKAKMSDIKREYTLLSNMSIFIFDLCSKHTYE